MWKVSRRGCRPHAGGRRQARTVHLDGVEHAAHHVHRRLVRRILVALPSPRAPRINELGFPCTLQARLREAGLRSRAGSSAGAAAGRWCHSAGAQECMAATQPSQCPTGLQKRSPFTAAAQAPFPRQGQLCTSPHCTGAGQRHSTGARLAKPLAGCEGGRFSYAHQLQRQVALHVGVRRPARVRPRAHAAWKPGRAPVSHAASALCLRRLQRQVRCQVKVHRPL